MEIKNLDVIDIKKWNYKTFHTSKMTMIYNVTIIIK